MLLIGDIMKFLSEVCFPVSIKQGWTVLGFVPDTSSSCS